MNTGRESREWKLDEINWQNRDEIKEGDLVRIDDWDIREVSGWLEDLKESNSGKLIGRRLLLRYGWFYGERLDRKVLYLIEGHELAIVTVQ